MAKIKIISNPYKNEVLYQRWNENLLNWVEINYENNCNSRLISDELSKCFLPFKIKEILDAIIQEYLSENKKLELVFEGTDDEYKDMVVICADEKYYEIVQLTKSEIYIENARDILPEIVDVFEELRTLVTKSVRDEDKIKREIEKFIEASNSIIPICVLGTYSSGKSTFINALIGSEILPSSDQPLTAKIYKIRKSEQSDRATIKFEYRGEIVNLRFRGSELVIDESFVDNELSIKILDGIKEMDSKTLPSIINKTLELINLYEDESKKMSDIIEIEVPFKSGILAASKKDYVIFDTPGSNSASNEKHLIVLKKAMEDLSNGLPIYISGYETLDTKDNADLYRVIKSMKELDSRFTMIIVNKADAARLPKEGFSKDYESKILSQSVPKKMYANGMYFVSSIMGLGVKNEGNFIDEYYSEIFEMQKCNYIDNSTKFHKALYTYDIAADQMKRKIIEESEKCESAIYANSGLFSVEQEIETFAVKYSSYNKCQQSKLYIDNIIQTTTDEINQNKAECEETKIRLGEALEKERKELIDKLEDRSDQLKYEFIQNHPDIRQDILNDINIIITSEELKILESTIERKHECDNDYEEQVKKVKESKDVIGENIKDNFKKFINSRSMDSLKEFGKDLASDFKENKENVNTLNAIKKSVDKATADVLLRIVSERFDNCKLETKKCFDQISKDYWTEKTVQIKEALIEIVTNCTSLTERERATLAGIIITYKELDLISHANNLFVKAHLVQGIRLGKIEIGGADKLNIEKIKRQYNSKMQESVDVQYRTINGSNEASFTTWLQNLLDKVEDNIVEFNPTLRSFSKIISEKTHEINELIAYQDIINHDRERINSMMEWKTD